MKDEQTAATATSRVLANVSVLTWVPSNAGRINTTDKHVIGVSAWVNAPDDDRYKSDQRGGEQAVTIVKRKLASEGIECLAVMQVEVTNLHERSIVNQPKGMSSSDDLGSLSDLGLRSV